MPGQNGHDGIDGTKGELGPQGPPGRKVSVPLRIKHIILALSALFNHLKGDRGVKGDAGYIQKVDFNSTHIVMMGPPGLPGPKVK